MSRLEAAAQATFYTAIWFAGILMVVATGPWSFLLFVVAGLAAFWWSTFSSLR